MELTGYSLAEIVSKNICKKMDISPCKPQGVVL